MSKSRRAFLHEVSTAAAVTAGSASSIIPQTTLDRISKNTGILRVGLLEAGDLGGAHTLIGGNDGGIQMYSEPNKLVFSVSPQNGGRLRLGALDQPGITMVGGSVHIEGDAVVDGSIKTSKLQIGELGRVLLDENALRIGTLDEEGLLTGFAATSDDVGGYSHGQIVWHISNETGELVSSQNWPYSGIGFGGNMLTISTMHSDISPAIYGMIRFNEYREFADGNIQFYRYSTISSFNYALHLSDFDCIYLYEGEVNPNAGYDGADTAISRGGASFGHGKLSIMTGGYPRIDVVGRLILNVGAHGEEHGLVLDGANVWVTGGGLILPSSYTTGQTYDGLIYYDSAEQAVKVYSNGAWKKLAYA